MALEANDRLVKAIACGTVAHMVSAERSNVLLGFEVPPGLLTFPPDVGTPSLPSRCGRVRFAVGIHTVERLRHWGRRPVRAPKGSRAAPRGRC